MADTNTNPLTGSPLADEEDAASALGSVNNAPEPADEENELHGVLALRKNLMVSFEKDVAKATKKPSGPAPVHPGTRPPMIPDAKKDARSGPNESRGMKRSSSAASIDSYNSTGSTISNTSCVRGSNNLMSVYLRIRPLSPRIVPGTEPITMEVVEDDDAASPTRIRTFPPSNSQAYKSIRQSSENGSNKNAVVTCGVKEFEFTRVFSSKTSQKEMYLSVASPLVKGLFKGQSALLFSFGNTNAGKTYTVMGETRSKEDRKCGIIPRALRDVIDGSNQQKNCSVHISFFEIYNDNVLDLLASEDESEKDVRKRSFALEPAYLKVRENKDGQIFVQGLTKHKIASVSQGVKIALSGKNRRQTASNNLNGESSRSHCIFQIELSFQEIVTDKIKTVSMWIVDLAGSERSKRTGNASRSKRAREAANINASLMNLMQCIRQLSDNQTRGGQGSGVVPFRSSKLSHLFMNHLTSSSAERTAMIVNVNPSSEDFDETQHVLSYAAVARNVKVNMKDYQKKIKVDNVKTTKEKDGAGLQKRQYQGKQKGRSPRKVAKLLTKLSPRALRSKNRAATSRPGSQASSISSSSSQMSRAQTAKPQPLKRAVKPKDIKMKDGPDSTNKEEELARMREAVEEEVREEVAEEFEERINQIRMQYEERIANANAVACSEESFLERSAKKLEKDTQEQYIDELRDTIEECEEEMERMREANERTIQELTSKHDQELEAARKEIEELRKIQFSRLQANEAELVLSETKGAMNEDDGANCGASDGTDSNTPQSSAESESLVFSAEKSSKDENEESEENQTVADTSATSLPRLRKLRYGRASEVACEASSTPPKSSTRKLCGSSNKKESRTPLSTISKASENALSTEGGEDGMSLRARLRSRLDAGS